MQFKYAIIEGEKSIVDRLQNSFKKFPEYHCVGVSNCYDASMDMILEHTPNVVFINVDTGSENTINAFNFVNDLYKYMRELPLFIALSATKEQAYDCMKNAFFDYMLKPVKDYDLRRALARMDLKPEEKSSKLCLKSYKDYRFIDIEDILFLKADNTSTDFFLADGTKVTAYKTLKFFETILPGNFTRIHNSYIVNQDHVSRINFGRSKCTIKNNRAHIPFSRSYKNNVVILEKELTKKAILSLN